MRRHTWPRLGIGVAMGLALLPLALIIAEEKPDASKAQFYTGKVVPLADVLAKSGAKLDADAAPHWLALVTEDGKAYPLVKDDGARMFFKDKRLLNRPMRLTARPAGGTGMVQVLQVHSMRDGQLRAVYYWCAICAIKRFEDMDCECCGAHMELREDAISP